MAAIAAEIERVRSLSGDGLRGGSAPRRLPMTHTTALQSRM
jgi:hypothetical protein